MAGKRKVHTAAFKAQVALAALKGDRTVNELAGHYGVHPTLIHGWKKQLLTGAEGVFGNTAQAASADAGTSTRMLKPVSLGNPFVPDPPALPAASMILLATIPAFAFFWVIVPAVAALLVWIGVLSAGFDDELAVATTA